MIPRTAGRDHIPSWQQVLADAVTDPQDLLRRLGIEAPPAFAVTGARRFPLRVPEGFIARMEPGNAADPLLRQVLPLEAEDAEVDGFTHDPLEEHGAMAVPGLLHKYRGRALLTVTGACGVHCRYCFRRHYPYADANPAAGRWRQALDYLAARTDVNEIILSGGDPLSLSDDRLRELVKLLETIPHLRILRIHTRLPVVIPERVTSQLLACLSTTRLHVTVVVHVNHANEIDAQVGEAMRALGTTGALLNQSVLLKGVNDSAEALVDLSHALFGVGVLPYYLHQLDPVQGAAHFRVGDAQALAIMREVHATLPGYLVPRLVRETAGAQGKILIGPSPRATGQS